MKKPIALAAFLVVGLISQSAMADVITLRGDAWCPYNCEPGSAKPGYVIEIAKEVFGKAGHTVDYKTLNWARTLDNVRNGEFVGAIGASKDDGKELLFPKLPIGKSGNTFAVRADDTFEYKDVASLDGKVLAIIDGYGYTDTINDYIAKNKSDSKKITTTPGDGALANNLNKLMAKRADLVIEDGNVLNSEIADMKLDGKVRVLKDPLPASDIYIAFSPKNPKSKEYMEVFDKGVAELRSSGKLAEILAKYNVKDWQ